jgi:hypothetical protein
MGLTVSQMILDDLSAAIGEAIRPDEEEVITATSDQTSQTCGSWAALWRGRKLMEVGRVDARYLPL